MILLLNRKICLITQLLPEVLIVIIMNLVQVQMHLLWKGDFLLIQLERFKLLRLIYMLLKIVWILMIALEKVRQIVFSYDYLLFMD